MAYTTIDNPGLYFNTVLYTGNASDDRSISGVGFQPDLLWLKRRNGVGSHRLVDSIRGATKTLVSNGNGAENTEADVIQAFESDGFQIGSDSASNADAGTMVSWNWKESATSGFDIVQFTGNATARTISHSLSAVPKMMIFRNRTNSTAAWSWGVYHVSNTATHSMHLNDTEAKEDHDTAYNDTEPTSSVFSVGTWGGTNYNTDAMIAYCFAAKQGFSKFGGYTGNANADGAFVYTGFRPAWVMVKLTSSTNNWLIHDNKRDVDNPTQEDLQANDDGAEDTNVRFDFLSNGFKCRTSADGVNDGTYIYMAFAEAPSVTSNGVP